PRLEGARVRLRDAIHRARRRGEQQHAVLLPLRDLAGYEPRAPEVALRLTHPDPRRRVQGRHLRHARDAGGEARGAAPKRGGRGRLSRSPRPGVRRHALGAARAGRLRLRRDRDRAHVARLRGDRRAREGRRRLPQRDEGDREREGVEALTVAQAGLGAWGQNLVRNVDDLARLAWICDTSVERLDALRRRYPNARATTEFDEMLSDDAVEAVVIATPVPTHHQLARDALDAGKHVFVEKPPAMRAAEMEELVALAQERGLVLMPGHLLLYHPGVRKLKELVDSGDLGDVLCV